MGVCNATEQDSGGTLVLQAPSFYRRMIVFVRRLATCHACWSVGSRRLPQPLHTQKTPYSYVPMVRPILLTAGLDGLVHTL